MAQREAAAGHQEQQDRPVDDEDRRREAKQDGGLLQSLRQCFGRGCLQAFDVGRHARNQLAGGVLKKELQRLAEDSREHVVAKVSNHSLSKPSGGGDGAVFGDAFENRCRNQQRQQRGAPPRRQVDADQRHRGRRHEEVEDDQPCPAVPVEERSGDRADDEAGEDPDEGDDSGELGGVVAAEREEDERDADHALRDPRDLGPGERPPEPRDGEERTV